MKYNSLKKGFANIVMAIVVGALAVLAGAVMARITNKPTPQLSTKVGAINYVTGGGTYRLGSSISSTQTTIKLSSFKEPVSGNLYTMTYLNSAKEYGTLDPQTSNSEFISFSGITQNSDGTATLTGVIRGLSRSYPYTASSTFQLTHSGQSIFILSNTPQIYNDIYDYINNATTSGAVDASPTIKGIVEIATANEAASNAAASSSQTSAYLALSSSISKSTRTANTPQVVVSSSTDGYIDPSYISPVTIGVSPVGSITAYASTSAPSGWLLADGSSVLRTTYPSLYSVLGTSYGSVDSTHFNLPNLTGRSIVMASSTQVATSSFNRATIGAVGGETAHTQARGEVGPHAHQETGIVATNSIAALSYPTSSGGTYSTLPVNTNISGGAGTTASLNTQDSAASSPMNVLDPYIVLNYIIKY